MSGPVVAAPEPSTVRVSVVSPADADADALRAWDDFVRGHPAADVAQLSGWARVRAAAGMSALLVLAHRDDRLLGGAQVLMRRVPLIGAIGYVAYGPLVDGGEDPGPVSQALAGELAALARTRIRMLFVQPPADGAEVAAALSSLGFRASDAGIAPRTSVMVDLALDEEELRGQLSRTLRRWINRWPRRGVEVRPAGEADLPQVAALLAQTGEHHGYTAFGLEYLQGMYRELCPTGDLVVLIGEVAGRPVATALYSTVGSAVKARLVGFDRDGEAATLNVPAALDWTAITWAKARGFRWFDHGGLSETATALVLSGADFDTEDLAGPDRYKLRFGGRPVRLPEPLESISSPLVRLGYDLARRSTGGRVLVDRAKRLARTGAALRDRGPAPDVLHRKVGGGMTGVQTAVRACYPPAGPATLRRLLPPRDIGADDVFVHIGSGTGRVVLQAALRYPFRTVYGVELSDRLHEAAVRNLDGIRPRLRCPDVRLVNTDAPQFDVPDDATIVLLSNPSGGAAFAETVQRILASVDRAPRPLRLVHGNPQEEETLLATGRVHRVRTLRRWRRPGREWSRSHTFCLYRVA